MRETPRVPATTNSGSRDYVANPADSPGGFHVSGTLPVEEAQGVHSLTDVMVYAWGPCQETFSGTYDNTDIFYKMANCFGLAQPKPEKPGCRRRLK